jgi:hypothetical protein
MPKTLRAILLFLIPLIYIGAVVTFVPHVTSLMIGMSTITITLLIGFCALVTYGTYELFKYVKNN